MNILAIDDEKLALERLCECIREVKPEAALFYFRCVKEAMELAKSCIIDVVFLDIYMQDMDGMEIAKILIQNNPMINIIFVTGSDKYSVDAFSLHASGYLLKPYQAEDIERELEHLRFPVEDKMSNDGVCVTCFGNFSAYIDGVPIKFKYLKTNELLAYLVHRKGALCTNRDIISVLFEDDYKSDYYQKLRADLIAHMPSDILIVRRGCIGIHEEKVRCDYYDYLKGKKHAINAYNGEYMAQFSWSGRL